ncbi:hypothetical protein [Metabacillus fastidiosus]|uniref:hypothetical protein n=1 Tax=Metabacillus fastidiosus TaxID=1458 RepID=UPI003D2C756A
MRYISPRQEKLNAVKKFINKENLIKYLIVHNMNWTTLAKMLNVSAATVKKYADDIGFNLQLQREEYALSYYQKAINRNSETVKVKRNKTHKPFAVIR